MGETMWQKCYRLLVIKKKTGVILNYVTVQIIYTKPNYLYNDNQFQINNKQIATINYNGE